MKYIFVVMVAITFVANVAVADYNVKSEFMKNPKKNIDLVVDTAEFWLSARDNVNGGFYN